MKKNFPTKKILLACFAIGAVALAGLARASYSNPTAAYPGDNTDAPIDTSATSQEKIMGQVQGAGGGLSVQSFISVGNAQFDTDTMIKGEIATDSNPATTDTVHVGTDTIANGDVHAAQHLNSQTLVHASGLNTLCADGNGTIISCN